MMFAIDDILNIASEDEFEQKALQLFRFQAQRCAPYREYLQLAGFGEKDIRNVDQLRKIPFLPIEVFKLRDVWCGEGEPEIVFTSSATSGMVPSRHPMARVADYERTFTAAFEAFYGPASQYAIFALLPSYLERQGSSLVLMADRLIAQCGAGGFYLDDYETLIRDMAACPKPKILLGVTYALLDLAEKYAPQLRDTVVMETGGMKGRREELPKSELHRILCSAFGVTEIHSEYGMAELTSQAYSCGEGIFRAPRWMKVLTRDVNDPFDMESAGGRGGVNIVDLANLSSCAFIQTQDMGRTYSDGSFAIEGRIDRSEIRGCNLLVQ